MFTETSKTDVFVTAPTHCLLSIVAVGGGGGRASSGYGGGGSGYLIHQRINMVGDNQFRVKVGAGGKSGKNGKDTTIDWGLNPWNEAYFRAQGGESALEPPNDTNGGAGYSGGGQGRKGFGNDGGEGGSDSSNGCCGELGGEGSGLDLSSIQQETFSLSPGAGGKKYMTAGGGGGGGGGGVLVDGEG